MDKKSRIRHRVAHIIKGSSGDKFQFKAPQSGMYKFCFHNQHSTPETVSFHIHIGHIPKEQDLTKGEHLNPIDAKIEELRELLESMKNEQVYLKYRDAWHRHTNENTGKHVIYFTVAEYLLLLVASGLQVGYIRRLFSKAVGYNRI